MHLVIVESPTKAKTIRKFLGSDYTVIASMGHVRDLPDSSTEIPAAFKDAKWANLGVDVEHDFTPLYVVPKKKTKIMSELKAALKTAEDVYLATDEDREGESISWHLLELLKPKVPVHRMVFHEITKHAIEEALKHPRELDERLVRAQETRRVLDRLVGYTISPVLWKKIAYGLSAGRVQSAALKAIVDRERLRMLFVKADYWDVSAALETSNNKDQASKFGAKLVETNGKRLATGKDFDEQTGKLSSGKNLILLDKSAAEKIAKEAETGSWKVIEVTEKPFTRRPSPPFITSTLQQEANRKLGLSSKDAMRVAQSLYEQGHITYMRTDSVTLSQDAIAAARQSVIKRFGKEYVPETSRQYANKSKGAQEAHEAIRPSLTFASPDEIGLSGAERAVYELIWMRTLASQMMDSKQLQISVSLQVASHVFSATGIRILFPGFLRAYAESAADESEQALEDMERPLPDLKAGDTPRCEETKAEGHTTKPPGRFTEAGLIQFMEKEGIGRPSTYASIVSTLLDRGYVRKVSNALVPTFTALAVTQVMEGHFPNLVDVKFTSTMEESLDNIAEGKEESLPYLRSFYLGEQGLENKIKTEVENIDPEEARKVVIPKLHDVTIRVGKFGPYFEAIHPKSQQLTKASIPEDVSPSDFTQEVAMEILNQAQQGPTSLGEDPATGKTIFLKTGSYGPYLQLGEDQPEGSKIKPKRVSVPKQIPLNTLDHQKAAVLISLPRLLGTHPETTKEVRAGLGKFGPYVVHDGDFRSLKAPDDVLTVDLARALELLAMPKGARRGAATLKTLGEHPKDKKMITLHQGKYGLYVKHGATNATLPKDLKPDDLTLEQALELLAARKTNKKTKKK
ncbi:MAG: type I DNA topoisomerase [Candidatus Uhrbacteria bacterium]|nr:type I DNA topoisomerase [Candidatus Uhrbacteria bacterium]